MHERQQVPLPALPRRRAEPLRRPRRSRWSRWGSRADGSRGQAPGPRRCPQLRSLFGGRRAGGDVGRCRHEWVIRCGVVPAASPLRSVSRAKTRPTACLWHLWLSRVGCLSCPSLRNVQQQQHTREWSASTVFRFARCPVPWPVLIR